MKISNKQKNSITGNNGTSGLGKKIAAIAIGVVVVLVLAIVIGIRVYYNGHWYSNTKIGDKDVSGMTLSEATKTMKEVYSSYELQIKGRNDGSLTINGDDIDYNVDVETAVKKAYENMRQ